MPHLMSAFKNLFVLGEILVYVDNIVPLEILVKSSGAVKRDKN